MRVFVDGRAVTLAPAQALAQGGEATIYDLGDGRVLKLWTAPDHPDLAGDPAAVAAAQARLDEQQHKLAALPTGLPAAAVTPTAVATTRARGGRVAGYVMPRIDGEVLLRWSEPRFRRAAQLGLADAVRVLVALVEAVRGLHARGVVIGDVSDLNVLVAPAAVRLVDVDSWQFGPYVTRTWTERFVDPRLCAAPGGVLTWVRPHDVGSDWFGVAVLACRLLLGIAPYAGVAASGTPPSLRALRGESIFTPGVTVPAWVPPAASLPAPMLAWLRATLDGQTTRAAPPLEALVGAVPRRCARCGLERLVDACPSCPATARALAPPPRAANLAVRLAAPDEFPRGAVRLGALPDDGAPALSLRGGTVWRHGPTGATPIGAVVGGQAHLLATADRLVGLYRVGALTVGVTARRGHGGLADGLRLPSIRGQLITAYLTVAGARAWLAWRAIEAGVATTTLIVLDGARLLGSFTDADAAAPWLLGVPGACAVGDALLVPTDDGIARVEVDAATGQLARVRTYAPTRGICSSNDALAPGRGGLLLRRRDDVLELRLT